MEPLVWCILLLGLGLVLILLEIFIPSGGILGFLAVGALIAGIALAFYRYPDRPEVGAIILVISLIGLPSVVVFGLKVFPNTPMGRRYLLAVPREEDVMPSGDERRALKELVGKIGVARSKMLPSGAIEVDDRTIDAMTEGMPVEEGQHVEVVDVQGNMVVVRPTQRSHMESPAKDDDVLSQPIDNLGIDPIDDPLA